MSMIRRACTRRVLPLSRLLTKTLAEQSKAGGARVKIARGFSSQKEEQTRGRWRWAIGGGIVGVLGYAVYNKVQDDQALVEMKPVQKKEIDGAVTDFPVKMTTRDNIALIHHRIWHQLVFLLHALNILEEKGAMTPEHKELRKQIIFQIEKKWQRVAECNVGRERNMLFGLYVFNELQTRMNESLEIGYTPYLEATQLVNNPLLDEIVKQSGLMEFALKRYEDSVKRELDEGEAYWETRIAAENYVAKIDTILQERGEC